MTLKRILSFALAAAVLSAAGSAQGEDARSVDLVAVRAPGPAGWVATPPASTMRVAQFDAGAQAEVIVFYFGPHKGGSVQANIARWKTQFSAPDGSAVEPSVRSFEVNGMAVTEAEFHGSYARGVGTGPKGVAKPDQTLRAAIVAGPRGKLFVQLFGDSDGVAAQRANFDTFVRGMRPGDG